MHLPAGSLDNLTCTVTTLLAAGATGYAVRRVRQAPGEWQSAKLGAVAAFIFAVQMVNYPVADGVSGHMVGGVLAGALLGPWAGLLAMALVLTAQCLLAGDGGLSTLGANILTMGVVATWGGAAFRRLVDTPTGASGRRQMLATAVAAWSSIVLAGTLCAVIWSAGSTLSVADVLGPMVSIHARIGIGEASITAIALAALQLWNSHAANTRRGAAMAFAVALAVAALLAPWASPSPDGLEHVARTRFNWPETTLAFAPLPDYLMPGVANELLATALAGVLGTLVVFGLGSASARAVTLTARAK